MPNYRQGGYNDGAQSFQILFNATERKELIKIEMPPNVISQPYSYVTETKELYVICEYEDKYEMYRANLGKY